MGQKKGETKVNCAEKKSEDSATIVLKLDLHCEGCAKKVRRFICHLKGVKDVKLDCENGKLTVIGNVDPSWLRECVENKTEKKVELMGSDNCCGHEENEPQEVILPQLHRVEIHAHKVVVNLGTWVAK